MASHKVIQDIEAEDKFVGPLTLRQFIFAMGGAFFGYLNVFAMGKGAPWAFLIFAPPMFFCFFLAIPWSKTQPTEVWFLAKLRFHFKPKRRIWNQSGLQELVTITVPKKPERVLTKNLSEEEVKSRLQALADTIDSRGWAIKHTTQQEASGDDRLINIASIPEPVPEEDLRNVPDVMDEKTAPLASSIEHMIEDKDKQRKQHLYDKMDNIRKGKPEEAPDKSLAVSPPLEEPHALSNQAEEQLLSAELEKRKASARLSEGNMHSIPSAKSKAKIKKPKIKSASTDEKKPQADMTTPVQPDILELAQNNDLNVATIARQANKKDDDNEVVVSLH
jgi:hypothetical protein